MTTPLAARIAREYGTPCAVIDMDRVERNIARIQAACDAAGLANRPHIKTHKSPMLARMQVAAGAHGITCQKLGEAEVMADAGVDDILISYNLLGEEKMARLGALQAKANMTVAADNSVVIADLPKAAAASGRPLSVVIECDTGRKRAGVETPAEAIALAREVAASKGLQFAGFMLYPTETGWVEAQKFFDEALAGVRAHGLDATMVSPENGYLRNTITQSWGYGYQVWILPGERRMFVLLGTNGQDLFVDPESKLVMVHTAVRKLAGFNPKSPEVVALWYAVVAQFGHR